MFSDRILHTISCNFKKINVGLFKFSTEEPSVLFFIRLLGEILLYQPRACTGPRKGATGHPEGWR